MDLSTLCKYLCKLDNNFPPYGLWNEYYNVVNFNKLIINNNTDKRELTII